MSLKDKFNGVLKNVVAGIKGLKGVKLSKVKINPNVLLLVSALLAIALALNYLWVSDSYQYSLRNIFVKKSQCEDLISEYNKGVKSINNFYTELDRLEGIEGSLRLESDKIKDLFDGKDYILHKPSLLIVLESEALKNKLDIVIYYNQIQSSDQVLKAIRDREESSDPSDASDASEDKKKGVEVNIKKDEENETEEKSTTVKVGKSDLIDGLIALKRQRSIENTIIYTLPVELTGKFDSIQNYVNFLEELYFITPEVIHMETIDLHSGDISVILILDIIHFEKR